MAVADKLKEIVADTLKRIPLIIAAVVLLALMGSGIVVGIFIRSITEMGTLIRMAEVVVPALIIGIMGCILAYRLATNFFPKPSREFVDRDGDDGGLPERKGKK